MAATTRPDPYSDVTADLLPQHEMYRGTIRQSRPLPKWLWYIIAKLVGVRIQPTDWPILGYAFFALTLISGLVYLLCTIVFYYFDVITSKTTFDALSYFITIIMAFGFFFIGLYGNMLARKLFARRAFVQSLRLHSRTVLKVSAPILLIGFGMGMLILFEVTNENIYRDSYCEKINMPTMLCHLRYIAQIVFASLAMLWNFLIALICFSACRTHTIGIRSFLLELDEDAMVCLLQDNRDQRGHASAHQRRKAHSFSEPTSPGPSETSPLLSGRDRGSVSRSRSQTELGGVVRDVLNDEWDNAEFYRRASSVNQLYPQQAFQFTPRFTIQNYEQATDGVFVDDRARNHHGANKEWPNLSTATGLTSYSAAPSSRMLSNKEILRKYWKLQSRLMTTSLALQRWLGCWIILMLSWSLIYLLYWISHEASITDMLKFCLPLFLLPLVCSGVTEVNSEGQRVPKSICLTEERLHVINMMLKQPLSFTIYGFPLNYPSLVTAIAAVAVAFATKIIVANINT